MASLESLKQALKKTAEGIPSVQKRPLSDRQYSAGFEILVRSGEWTTYQDFIIPQLSQLFLDLLRSRSYISVLEIGPGPKSVLGFLPDYFRQKIKRYTAFEPNGVYAADLQEWVCDTSEMKSPLAGLETPPEIHKVPFMPGDKPSGDAGTYANDGDKYDIILFCHSMYGMRPKRYFIEQALKMLVEQPLGGMVVVFHREGGLYLNGLVCHRAATFRTGVVCVADREETLNHFASFIAGFRIQDAEKDKAVCARWRETCRSLGRRKKADSDHVSFNSPMIMATFTQHATALSELASLLPMVKENRIIKNQEARLQRPASIVRPTTVEHVQQCVQWALNHRLGLTVLGGSHSGQCVWPNVVSIDMSAFNQMHMTEVKVGPESNFYIAAYAAVGTGCTTGDIISKTMKEGVTLPLGSRPSVGAGLWLQGGIGHIARLYGLTCDAIVGAVMVSVKSGEIFCVGYVPSTQRPANAVQPDDDADILWALKGAGTNFGIVISVIFKTFAAPTHRTRKWVFPFSKSREARLKLGEYDRLAGQLDSTCSADAYLYWDCGQLHLGVIMFESYITEPPDSTLARAIWGVEAESKEVDGVGLFDADMYVSGMHSEHVGGKTSSFKRCLFFNHIGRAEIAERLVAAVESRPSSLCYLHFLQGGGAVGQVAADATAFGCRDWDFACVITGVWPRHQDGTEAAHSAASWVYRVARDLMPYINGAYGADLGPDPRDAALAASAFGRNGPRLGQLKQRLDPHNVLAYTCPLLAAHQKPKLIIIVTGQSGVGKDYCANVWTSAFTRLRHKGLTARAVSISDSTKQEYAAATGADMDRLVHDRAYKEDHRQALSAFYQEKKEQRPWLPEENFLDLVYGARDIDVLIITGMRDQAPVVALSHLVPESRLLDVHIQASEHTRHIRRGRRDDNNPSEESKADKKFISDSTGWEYSPSYVFENDQSGNMAVDSFAELHLLPFFHEDIEQLAKMVHSVADFPRSGIEFRHILGIAQQQGGLALCSSLLRTRFIGDWAKVDAVVSCEAGGFIFASALASDVNVPLVLVREAGKLPPPTVSVSRTSSHISQDSKEKSFHMGQHVITSGASVVVVDDVLATGATLCAVLHLLKKAGVDAENVSVMVVAEFPVHGGRNFLRQCGFGRSSIRSLLVFGGA